jgi:hypothetical protein
LQSKEKFNCKKPAYRIQQLFLLSSKGVLPMRTSVEHLQKKYREMCKEEEEEEEEVFL